MAHGFDGLGILLLSVLIAAAFPQQTAGQSSIGASPIRGTLVVVPSRDGL